jgi:hypothetical protein
MNDRQRPLSQQLSLLSLVLLVLSLPFEVDALAVDLGFIQVTQIELLLMTTISLAFITVVRQRRWQERGWSKLPAWWAVMGIVFVLASLLAAVTAPEEQANAIRATMRTFSGLALALTVPQIIRQRRDLLWVAGALLVGGLLAAGLGLAEVLIGRPLVGLMLFRPQPTVAGPFIRLTGPFDHANQAAMFIEATLPLLLAAIWLGWQERRHWLVGAAVLAGLLYLQAAVLSLSRASFATIFLSCLAVAGLLSWRTAGRPLKAARLWAGAANLVGLMVLFNTLYSPVLRLRLSSEGDIEWYRVDFQVPEELSLAAGRAVPITVSLTNKGALLWSSDLAQPINLGYRWYRAADERRSSIEFRWPFDTEVRPGDTVTMTVMIQTPDEPGAYRLEWDVIQEDVIWFSAKTGHHTYSQVTVLPDDDEASGLITGGTFTEEDIKIQPIPSRSVLWRLAGERLLERPLTGIGLDNFRLTYGRYLGNDLWNESIHTNNWYIETAVSLGFLGSLPFLLWLLLLGLDLVRNLRSPTLTAGRNGIWLVAVATGIMAFLIHGLLDYFILFNSTGLLFWLLIGLWLFARIDGTQDNR